MAEQPAVALSLDVVDLRCPLPVLMARKALGPLAPGAVIEVLASDAGADADFEAFCATSGHRLIGRSETGGVLRFLIEKGSGSESGG